MSARRIIHMDMDAFYAAVEVLDNPALKGRPVIVGGLGPRGVVSTASYEARAYGVRSAQPTALARRLCPRGVFLPGRMARYQELSRHIMTIFRRYTPLVEPLSLDEAFLDVSGSRRLFGPALDIALRLKAEVRAETGLTVSAGVAGQKHLAKIASGRHKPDGLTVVPAGGESAFLRSLPLSELWGVGRVTLAGLAELGLATVGDLAALDPAGLEKKFGLAGGGGGCWPTAGTTGKSSRSGGRSRSGPKKPSPGTCPNPRPSGRPFWPRPWRPWPACAGRV